MTSNIKSQSFLKLVGRALLVGQAWRPPLEIPIASGSGPIRAEHQSLRRCPRSSSPLSGSAQDGGESRFQSKVRFFDVVNDNLSNVRGN